MKILKWLIVSVIAILLIWLYHSPWFNQFLDENLQFLTELGAEWGYSILLLTIPLAIFQGVFNVFPILAIIVIHILSFGLIEGLFYSYIGSLLGSIVCFLCGRYFFYEWAMKQWDTKLHKYKKYSTYVNMYGFWALFVLRMIPFMPSNVISLLGALSPMTLRAYVYASIVSVFSMVWLLSILSAPLSLTGRNYERFIGLYVLFCIGMAVLFWVQHRRRSQSQPRSDQQ